LGLSSEYVLAFAAGIAATGIWMTLVFGVFAADPFLLTI
jgi:hypothetical protein